MGVEMANEGNVPDFDLKIPSLDLDLPEPDMNSGGSDLSSAVSAADLKLDAPLDLPGSSTGQSGAASSNKPANKKADKKPMKMPKLAIPKLAVPKIAMPKISVPKLAIPKVTKPRIAKPRAAKPTAATPKTAQPKMNRPKVARPKMQRLPRAAVLPVSLNALSIVILFFLTGILFLFEVPINVVPDLTLTTYVQSLWLVVGCLIIVAMLQDIKTALVLIGIDLAMIATIFPTLWLLLELPMNPMYLFVIGMIVLLALVVVPLNVTNALKPAPKPAGATPAAPASKGPRTVS
jgi:hypothetical protein